MLIWVNQGLNNKINVFPNQTCCILQINFHLFWYAFGRGIMSSRQCKLSTCVFLLCRQHMFQWVLFHVLNSLHLHRLLWLFQTEFYQIHPFLQRNNTYTEGAWKIMALISSRLLFLSQIAIVPPCVKYLWDLIFYHLCRFSREL